MNENLIDVLEKILKLQFDGAHKSNSQWFSVSAGMALLLSQLSNIPKEVYAIDTAMTNLYKATDETKEKYKQFLHMANNSSFELGIPVSSLIQQTANWAKLGYNLDNAAKLAEISTVYTNVGDVDDGTAMSHIVTAMKAFNITAEESIRIVNSLNNLENEFTTDAGSLGEGLSKSASALAFAGNDIHKALAMITGGAAITQNASEMGDATKVLSMRIRGMKDELEKLGGKYNDVGTASQMQAQILERTNGSVDIFDNTGNIRATYNILEDIATVWENISHTDQTALLDIIAGKEYSSQISALIHSFQSGQTQKAYEASKNSDNSAMQEQELHLESLGAKTQQFEAAFQSMASTVHDSGLLKGFVDLGTTGVKAFDGLISAINAFTSLGGNINSLGSTIGAISGYLLNKNGVGEQITFQW